MLIPLSCMGAALAAVQAALGGLAARKEILEVLKPPLARTSQGAWMHAIAAMKECLPKSRPKSAGTEAGPSLPVSHLGVPGRDILLHSHSGSRVHTRCELQASALMHTGRQMQSFTSTSPPAVRHLLPSRQHTLSLVLCCISVCCLDGNRCLTAGAVNLQTPSES